MIGYGHDKIEEFADGLVPKGSYVCIMADCKNVDSRSGTPGINFKWKICDGPMSGRFIFSSLWFTDSAKPIFMPQLEKVGCFKHIAPANTMENYRDNCAKILFQLCDKKCEVKVNHQKDKQTGDMRLDPRINGYLDTPIKFKGSAGSDMDEEIPF